MKHVPDLAIKVHRIPPGGGEFRIHDGLCQTEQEERCHQRRQERVGDTANSAPEAALRCVVCATVHDQSNAIGLAVWPVRRRTT